MNDEHYQDENPYESPDTEGAGAEREERPWGGRLIQFLVVLGVIGLAVALLLPAVRYSPDASRRMYCVNNLKMIGLALHLYESEYGTFPPAYTVDADGNRLHSWRTLILPYMEQTALYDTIDLGKRWNHPVNQEAYETTLPCYACPSAECPAGHTNYLAVVGKGCCFDGTTARTLAEITDDHDRTLMVLGVSSDQSVHWMSPTDITLQQFLNQEQEAYEVHPSGYNALFVSGYVRFITSTLEPEKLQALLSIGGGDDDVVGEDY